MIAFRNAKLIIGCDQCAGEIEEILPGRPWDEKEAAAAAVPTLPVFCSERCEKAYTPPKTPEPVKA